MTKITMPMTESELMQEKKSHGRSEFIHSRNRAVITIYEETHSGALRRRVDLSELGISETPISSTKSTQETNEMKEKVPCHKGKPDRPVYPIIYETRFGGRQKRIVSIEELRS